MIKRLLVYVAGALFLLSASGCVANSTYMKKVEEAEVLSKELTELQQTYKKLVLDNDALKTRFKRLTDDAAVLASEKKQLEGIIKSKSDTVSKNISELRQQVAEMRVENKKLSDDISELQKAKDEKVKELNDKIAELQIAKEVSVKELNDKIAGLQITKEEKVKEVSGTYDQLLANMKNEIAKGHVTISDLKGKLTVNIEAAILFDSRRADVKPEGLNILGKMVETLKKVNDKAIRIEGHTDVVQIKGGLTRTFPTNWELSAARAINVTKFLQKHGVDPRNLSAAAYAEYKPVADNGTKEGRAKNSRIEITLVNKD